jgi:hypothetical protein
VSHQDLTWRMTLFVVVLVLVLMAAAAAAATASLQSHRILMGITVDAEEDATMKDKPIMPWKVDKLGAVSGLSVGEGVRGGRGSSWDILLSTIYIFIFFSFSSAYLLIRKMLGVLPVGTPDVLPVLRKI